MTVRRKLSAPEYFEIEKPMQFPSDPKMEYTPTTNMGCESEFWKLDIRVKVSGGTAGVQLLSMKNIVVTTGLLIRK